VFWERGSPTFILENMVNERAILPRDRHDVTPKAAAEPLRK
jgi:hypothetical protein